MTQDADWGNTAARTVTVEQAARVLGIGRGLAYQAVKRGDIPSIRIGGRILIPRARILELLGEDDGRGEAA